MISKQNGISKISINVYEGGGGREINFSSFIFFFKFLLLLLYATK